MAYYCGSKANQLISLTTRYESPQRVHDSTSNVAAWVNACRSAIARPINYLRPDRRVLSGVGHAWRRVKPFPGVDVAKVGPLKHPLVNKWVEKGYLYRAVPKESCQGSLCEDDTG